MQSLITHKGGAMGGGGKGQKPPLQISKQGEN